MSYKDMGKFVVGWVSTGWCLPLISRKCRPAEAKPMFTAFTGAVAIQTEII
jgi:hypothetical protein